MNKPPRTVARTGTLRVDAPPHHAFQLFTAPGERLWIDGWDPEVLSGGDGRARGAVWVTTVGGEETCWLVVDYDETALRARYARVVPGSRAGLVSVAARDDGAGATEVEVTYQLTGLSDAGNAQLAAFDGVAFDRMLRDWERMIRAANLEYPLPFVTAGVTSPALSSDR